jgi:hypothetical protein
LFLFYFFSYFFFFGGCAGVAVFNISVLFVFFGLKKKPRQVPEQRQPHGVGLRPGLCDGHLHGHDHVSHSRKQT